MITTFMRSVASIALVVLVGTAFLLKALLGIGDASSTKDHQRAILQAEDELVQKKLSPQPTYDKIKDGQAEVEA